MIYRVIYRHKIILQILKYSMCGKVLSIPTTTIYILKTEKTFKNEQRSKDAAAKKRPNTSGVGKIYNYYEDIYIPPYNNTD